MNKKLHRPKNPYNSITALMEVVVATAVMAMILPVALNTISMTRSNMGTGTFYVNKTEQSEFEKEIISMHRKMK